MVKFFTEGVEFPFKQKGVRALIRQYIKYLVDFETKKVGEINIIFCSDSYLLNMNNQYLGHNYYTDVITFDYSNFPIVSGDVFISIDTVKANAVEYSPSFEHELYRVIFHGVLHLCGYADSTEEQQEQMREKENLYLQMNNITT